MDGSCLNHSCPYSHCINISHGTRRRTVTVTSLTFSDFSRSIRACLLPFGSFTRDSLILCLLECPKYYQFELDSSYGLAVAVPGFAGTLYLKSTGAGIITALVLKRQLLLDIRCRHSVYIRVRRYLVIAKQLSACKKVPAVTSFPALPVLKNFCTV